MKRSLTFLVLLTLCGGVVTDCTNNKTTNVLSYVSPESQGVPSDAIVSLMDDWEQNNLNMHSFMLIRKGKVLAE